MKTCLGVVACCFILIFLSACSTTEHKSAGTAYPLYPDVFSGYQSTPVESPQQVMVLPEEAIEFLDSALSQAEQNGRLLVDVLIDSLFSRRQLGLSYFSDANFTVAETFQYREANCLSLTLMAYALAREAGLSAQLQQIEIPEYWSRKQGFSVLNGHVNLVLMEQTEHGTERRVVDFDERLASQGFSSSKLPLNTAIAMFYNNKAAIHLIQGEFGSAYRYLESALSSDTAFVQGWVNLGVLYRLNQRNDYAEQAYKRAIYLDREQLTAKENLAILYRLTHRERLAKKLAQEVHDARLQNPFYHLILGDEAFDSGEVELAFERYRRAYRLERGNHLILFALGKAAFAQGNIDIAHRYWQRAYQQARVHADKDRYAAKLAILTQQYGEE